LISSWHHEARRELIARRAPSSVWSYRSASAPSVEPTVMASLALLASGDAQTSQSDLEICDGAARWLTAVQRSDGSLPIAVGLHSPAGWPTPHAVLLWSVLTGYLAPASRARSWLLGRKGEAIVVDQGANKLLGHDPRLIGWPWVESTHSWLEPTAMAILALCHLGLAKHPRVTAGIELILDRALSAGGWNYGNKSVYGTELRPQPGPTGLALLALAAVNVRSPAVTHGLNYLSTAVENLRSPVSLGWAILGLRAHQQSPADADLRLAQACSRSIDKADAVMGLALALLASGEPALSLLINPSSAA
jgi:hypothetical protein